MPDSTIGGLASRGVPARATDLLIVEDVAANSTKKATVAQVFGALLDTDIPNRASDKQFLNQFEDFMGSSSSSWTFLTANNGGAGSNVSNAFVNNNQVMGVVLCQTGSSTTGRSGVTTQNGFRTGAAKVELIWKARITTFPDATEDYQVRMGVTNNTGDVTFPEGVGFQMLYPNANWFITRNIGGVITTVDTGVSVNTGFRRFRMVINADRTEEWSIDDTVLTAPSGILGNNNQNLAFTCGIYKTAGVTARNIEVDYVHMRVTTTGVTR